MGRLVFAVHKGRQAKRVLIGKTLAELLQHLGPTYVKCGQILATRWDLLPPEIIDELQKLQDAATPLNFDMVSRQREDEFGFDVETAFAEVDVEPLASGSVSCVYHGITWDGRCVAIKIRRPKICLIVAQDVACLKAVARAFCKFQRFRNVPVVAVADTICVAMEEQLDFERELEMIRRLRKAFDGEASVLLPEPLDALCGPAVITMELLDQFRPTNRNRNISDGTLREAATAGLRALYRMIFVEGLIHCDLHGGNIRLLHDGRVAIVDFGLVAQMDRADRLKFSEFFYSVAIADGRHCAAIIVDTASSLSASLPYDRFEAEIVSLVDSIGSTPATFSVSNFVIQLFEIQSRYGIVGSSKFMSAILSLFVFEGIVRHRVPDLDFQREAQRYIFLGSFPQEQNSKYAQLAVA
jgi:ubiquinone biosynthesis protein